MKLDPDAMPREELARLRAEGYGHLIGKSAAERAAEHPEDTCEECGGPNVVWFAPSEVWNVAVDENRGLILCPICFIRRAEARGIEPTAWVVQPEEPSRC